MISTIFIIIGLALGTAGTHPNAIANHYTDNNSIPARRIKAVAASYENITAEQARQILLSGEDVLFLDVREP